MVAFVQKYDSNGNRITANSNTYSTGVDNRLLFDGTFNYTYDAEGNRLSRVRLSNVAADDYRTEYTYDYRNRLTNVTFKNNLGVVTKSVDYTYDYLNRRIMQKIDGNGAAAGGVDYSYNVYQGDNAALEINDLNGLATSGTGENAPHRQHRYLYGSAVDEILASENTAAAGNATGAILWGLGDNQGTIRDIVDSATRTVTDHRKFDSFGNITSETAPTTDFIFGYTGQALDKATGLSDFGHRWYDAALGRFVTEDPSGFSAGDMNLYRYVNNNPWNNTDPSGLCGQSSFNSGISWSSPLNNSWTAQQSWTESYNSKLYTVSRNLQTASAQCSQSLAAGDMAAHQVANKSYVNYRQELETVRQQMLSENPEWTNSLLEFQNSVGNVNLNGQATAQIANSPDDFRSTMLAAGQNWNQSAADYVKNVQPSPNLAWEMTRDFGSGLGTGGKAIVNGTYQFAGSTASLGFWQPGDMISVNNWDRGVGYDASKFVVGVTLNAEFGLATGGAAGALSKGGQVARAGAYAIEGFQTASNLSQVGRGAYDIYDEGLNWQNASQIVGGSVGLGSNYFAFSRYANSTVNTGVNTVYQSIDSTGNVNYVGITNNLEQRAAQHLGQKGISIEAIPGLSTLSRSDARSVEQVLIETYGIGKNGGTLMNKINSIAPSNPIYNQSIQRGTQILKQTKYPGF